LGLSPTVWHTESLQAEPQPCEMHIQEKWNAVMEQQGFEQTVTKIDATVG
jgi:hypothetical protein